MRRIVLFVAATLVAGTFAGIQAASAAPGGAGCHISGMAMFSKGLTTTAQNVTYKFTGKLDNCQSSSATGYTSATVSAKGKGSLSCGANGTSTGIATVKWNTGHKSIVTYTTNSDGALVVLQGTVKSGDLKGDGALGSLAFEANPPDCAGAGVKMANFDGFTGYGSYQ